MAQKHEQQRRRKGGANAKMLALAKPDLRHPMDFKLTSHLISRIMMISCFFVTFNKINKKTADTRKQSEIVNLNLESVLI